MTKGENFTITVVAFRDDKKHSVAYMSFDTIEAAVAFYANQLGKPEVKVISTRKIKNASS